MRMFRVGSLFKEKEFYSVMKKIMHKAYKDFTEEEKVLHDLFMDNVTTIVVDDGVCHFTLIGGETVTL